MDIDFTRFFVDQIRRLPILFRMVPQTALKPKGTLAPSGHEIISIL